MNCMCWITEVESLSLRRRNKLRKLYVLQSGSAVLSQARLSLFLGKCAAATSGFVHKILMRGGRQASSAAGNRMVVSLLDLQEHLNDYDWLDEHHNSLHRQIIKDLEYPSSAQQAIDCLNLIMPYALTRHDYGRWLNPLYDALLHGMELKDDEIQIQIWAHLGNCLFQRANYRSASANFRKALERCDLDATPETLLLARIGMLRTKTIFESRDIDRFIDEALDAAQAIANYHLLGKLHYTLAVSYGHQGETEKGLGHGQVALACWYQEKNTVEIERTALALAEICRVAKCFAQAGRYFDLVHPGSEDIYITGISHYHRGSVLLETDQFAEAQNALEQALQHFIKLDFPYMTAATHHTLALVQTKRDTFDDARANLRRALILWQEVDNMFQQVNCVYALGFLERRASNPHEARRLYQRALQLAEGLPKTQTLLELVQELETELTELGQ